MGGGDRNDRGTVVVIVWFLILGAILVAAALLVD